MPARASRKKYWIFGIVIIAGLLSWQFFFSGKEKRTDMNPGLPPVRVAKAIAQNVPQFLSGLGTVIPSGDVLVQSRVDGQLMKLHFKEGQRVKAGDLLAEIDSRPFKASLNQALGALQRDMAQLENARRDLARYEKLAKGDYIAEQQYENQKALVRQYQGTVDADQAAVASARLQVEYSSITAPISGRLGLRAVDEGNQVKANDSQGIARITETNPCDVLFTIPENQVYLVSEALHEKERNPAHPPILAQAWDRENRVLLATGELLSLDNQIDSATGTVRLKARFPNPDDKLFPNQFVNVRLLVRVLKDAATIPSAAVQLGAKGSYCYVVNRPEDDEDSDTGAVVYTEIKPGLNIEGLTVVDSGVDPGQYVVVDGIDRLRDGSRVVIAAEMETPRIAALDDGQTDADKSLDF
ncbi:MAG: MdtA/MuxA family multidrug efflux RND transporter periplasmic adaptor subunit [Desulfovibrio sp.]|nr:MdtA/MuxA family multidrug efflux RND transporter periplasmic adaptor subunit [Desulfovibrio sp.]